MAEATRWRWIRTDPTTGAVADLTYLQYTPPAALATLVKVRDRTCRFAGCMRRARGCDIDHRTPWPLGATCDDNCACLCRRHHRAKHEGGWKLDRSKAGWCTWTSPAGNTHVVEPEPVVVVDPPDDPAPVLTEVTSLATVTQRASAVRRNAVPSSANGTTPGVPKKPGYTQEAKATRIGVSVEPRPP